MSSLHHFRPVSISLKNISGMTTDLTFSNEMVPFPKLIAIYGYNRTGKTKLIDGIKYTITGFKTKLPPPRDLKMILGEELSGRACFIFEYRNILYKIERKLFSKGNVEHVSFISSKMSTKDFLGQKPQFRELAWSEEYVNKEYMKGEEVKLSPSSFEEHYQDIFIELDLKKSILERMIAKDNVEEFQRAVKNALETSKTGKSELGYQNIKKILSAELIELQSSVEKSIKVNDKTRKKISEFSSKLLKDHQNWMEGELNSIEEKEFKKKDELEISKYVQSLCLSDSTNTIQLCKEGLIRIKENFIDNFSKFDYEISWIDNNKGKYEELETCLRNSELGALNEITIRFSENYKEYIEYNKETNRVLLDIKNNLDEIEPYNFDFKNLLNPEIKGITKNFELLPMKNESMITSIISDSEKICDYVNKVAKLTKRKNELQKKYGISDSSDASLLLGDPIFSKRRHLQEQLKKIKKPITKTKLKESIPLLGKEVDGKIQIYIGLKDLQNLIKMEKSLNLDDYVIPYKEKDEDKISKSLLNELSRGIENRISELNELETINKELDKQYSLTSQILKKLQNVDNQVSTIKEVIENWKNRLTEFKGIGNRLLTRNVPRYINEDNVTTLIKNIKKEGKKWINELKERMENHFDPEEEITKNLNDYQRTISKNRSNYDKYRKNIERIIEDINNYQGQYITLQKKYINSQHIITVVLPLIEVVSSQIASNINLENIDQRILKDIANQAKKLYRGISGEDNLRIHEEIDENGDMFLTFSIRNSEGNEIQILDTDPSGSEQAAISLGAMYALAKLFHTFLVMDEISDKFDPISKKNFYQAINTVSNDVITLIVLKVDRPDDEINEELSEMMESFEDSIFIQAFRKSDGTLGAKILENPSSFKSKEV